MALGPLLRLIPLAIAKSLSKLFGLATVFFFGRAPSRDDHKFALVGLLSVTWCALLVGIAFPRLAETMLPFLPDEDMVLQATALGLVLVIGPVIGLVIARTTNRKETGSRLMLTALQGYGFAFVIGLLTLALIIVVPIVKISHLLRNLEMHHIPVMVPAQGFDDVERRILKILRDNGFDVQVDRENPILRTIFRVLVWVEAKVFRREMSGRLSVIRAEVEDGPLIVELHPTDISVRARNDQASYVFALIADSLDERHLYFTWDAPAQEIEDRIRKAREAAESGDPPDDREIAALAQEVRTLGLDPEQWNALRRQVHQLEAQALRGRHERAALGRHEGPERVS